MTRGGRVRGDRHGAVDEGCRDCVRSRVTGEAVVVQKLYVMDVSASCVKMVVEVAICDLFVANGVNIEATVTVIPVMLLSHWHSHSFGVVTECELPAERFQ